MSLRRCLLAVLLVTSVYTGVWAYFAPFHWYQHFPGFGMTWLPQLGPYNQHFAKDIGAMYLALSALSAIALWRARSDALVRTTGGATLVFNALHFIYHVTHLHVYSTMDKIVAVAILAALVVVSLALLIAMPGARQHREKVNRPGARG